MNSIITVKSRAQVGSLFLYDAACAAVAEALHVDEILEITSRAEAVRAYARQARNRELEIQATEIRIRALRRLGQLLNAIKVEGRIEPDEEGDPKKMKARRWLRILASEKIGVNRNLTIKALKAAALSDEQYDNLMVGWRKRCIEENKIYLTIEPRIPPAQGSPHNEPECPASLFDEYRLANDEYTNQSIGDVHMHQIDECINELQSDFEEMSHRFGVSYVLLNKIRDHFGGGIMRRRDGDPVELRDVLSEAKLAEFIAYAERACAPVDQSVATESASATHLQAAE